LSDDIATQAGTFALVPQVVDAVEVPVIAAGAITDARRIAAAFALGAAACRSARRICGVPRRKSRLRIAPRSNPRAMTARH
jgi:nitronate monooxygenase